MNTVRGYACPFKICNWKDKTEVFQLLNTRLNITIGLKTVFILHLQSVELDLKRNRFHCLCGIGSKEKKECVAC